MIKMVEVVRIKVAVIIRSNGDNENNKYNKNNNRNC